MQMLISGNEMEGFDVCGPDGRLGSVKDWHFDDESWVVRHLVVKPAGWFRHPILIAPRSIVAVDRKARRLELALTRAQIAGSPPLEADRPIALQRAATYYSYFGWPYYWSDAGWTGVPRASLFSPARDGDISSDDRGDPHLRSAREVVGYHVQASDERIGHVADLILDDQRWKIRYLVIDTRNWWFGRDVVIDPRWAVGIDWQERLVHLDLSCEAIRHSPPWDPGHPVERTYEARLHEHYRRRPYWEDEGDGPSEAVQPPAP
jgi:sporulation protein YlmC with PRC-barrel domain